MIEVLREKYGKGVCISCGYFGKRMRDPSDTECDGVSVYERESGNLDTSRGVNVIPWCFVNQCDLVREVEVGPGQVPKADSVAGMAKKQRNCPAWYPYREFASPKEQWNEAAMLVMEQRREDFEKALEQDRQKFELKLFEMSQAIQEDSKRTSDRIHWLTWILALFGMCQIGITIAMYVWPR